MKTPNKIIFILIVIFILLFGIYYYSNNKKAQVNVYENNQVLSENGTKNSKVKAGDTSSIKYINASEDKIKVTFPLIMGVTDNNFTIEGEARGNWFFEGVARVKILDDTGSIIFEGKATAKSNYMTEDLVPFSADVNLDYSGMATLIIMNDNPSGLPEKDSSISFPIIIK